ncbi:ATP-dependent DNA helicase [Candidatus Micrarchaeota archaeon]|nr:ATP-dependent DNA helicase [Candidatus Micrarchaeota archaeon]
MPKVYFRHSKIRAFQAKLISYVYNAIEKQNHFLAHAPCGTGKTDAVLAAAITYALNNQKDILFLTPKISQHKIVAETILGIEEKYNLGIRAADVVGKISMCAHPALTQLDHDGFYQSCEKLRKDKKCPYYVAARGGNPEENAKAELFFHKVVSSYGPIKKHGDFTLEMSKLEACPYEIMLRIASSSNLIIADYFHVLEPSIRAAFFAKSKKRLEDCIVILDEAHNLPKRVRDYLSSSLNTKMISKMEKEMQELGGKMEFQNDFREWASEFLGKEKEKKLNPEDFNSPLNYFSMPPEEICAYFESLGIAYIEKTNRKSALLRFSRFVRTWFKEKPGEVRILKGKQNFFSLSRHSMDPSSITSILNNAHSAVLMSATLHPMEMYRDVLGLDPSRTMMESYPSPFPSSNRLDLIVKGVTTKYTHRNEDQYKRIANLVDSIHSSYKGGTAVFFPSYGVLDKVLPFVNSNPLHIQKENTKPKDLHLLAKNFSDSGGLLIGVQGGSLSEGIDFAKSEIKKAVIVGVALEEMGIEVEALIKYYQKKFGKGWEYAYIYPAVVRAMQAAGRAIRKEEDKAAVIYLDERFAWSAYKNLFPNKKDFLFSDFEDVSARLSGFLKD